MTSSQSLRPLDRKPLYEQVSDRLREFIDLNELKPGDRLPTERDLAQRIGVSRHSVRQAFAALRAIGLIDIRHGDGVYLLQPPDEVVPSLAFELLEIQSDYPYIWEVRQALETQGARLAARRKTKVDITSLHDALRAMAAEIQAGEDGVEGDRRFHAAILEAAHNPLLSKVVGQLGEAFHRTSAASLSQAGQPQRSLNDHHEILAAIEAGDEPGAGARMLQHLQSTTDVAFVRKPD